MSTTNEANDGRAIVQYSVKELLSNQNDTLARMERKLDGKANQADLLRFQSELSATKEEVQTIKTDIAERHGEEQHGRRVWATAGVVGSILAVFGSGLLGALVVK